MRRSLVQRWPFSLTTAPSTLTTAGHAFGKDIFDMRFGPSFEYVEAAFALARDCLSFGLPVVAPLFSAKTT